MNGTCTVQRLAVLASMSMSSAANTITYPQSGLISRPTKERGYQCKGIGTIGGWKATHNTMTWDLYLDNTSRLLTGYVE